MEAEEIMTDWVGKVMNLWCHGNVILLVMWFHWHCYIFVWFCSWLCCYLSQMNPLIGPKLSN